MSYCLQELYNVEHFAFKTVAVTFWRLPVIFIVIFLVRGVPQLAPHQPSSFHSMTEYMVDD